MILDSYGKIIDCSKNSEDVFGFGPERLKGKLFWDLMSFHDRRFFEQSEKFSSILSYNQNFSSTSSDESIDDIEEKKSNYIGTFKFLMPHLLFDDLWKVKSITCKISIKKSKIFEK